MKKDIETYQLHNALRRSLTKAPTELTDHSQRLQLHRIEKLIPYLKLPMPLFRGDFNCIILLTKGGFEQQSGTNSVVCSARTALWTRKGQTTALSWVDPSTEGYLLIFDDDLLTNLLDRQQILASLEANLSARITDEQFPIVHDLYQLIERTLQQPGEQKWHTCTHLLAALLHRLIGTKSAERSTRERSYEITYAFKQMAYQQATRERRVSYYATALSISEKYLDRCVAETTGKSPKVWLIDFCLLESKQRLEHTSASISEVAYAVGFDDPSYFGRLFRKRFGITPSAFRASLK